jgi:peptidoglycan/LPS O-acetylase OafA/YrhL
MLNPTRRYRSDIDGLRAVAVLLVIACHLGFGWFAGGYVGVDVFFVISGYLIGGSVLAEMGARQFSLVTFYERRVRRILPALMVMLLVVSAMVFIVQSPEERAGYPASLEAAALSVSNFLFWGQAGYFDAASLTKPLLHTWSLGVEEQFYLFFPLAMLYLAHRFPRHLRSSLWWLWTVGFAAAVVATGLHHVSLAYYWSPLRGWELMTGVLVSQYAPGFLRRRVSREASSALGLAMIVATGALYSSQTLFPGWTALLPCGGAALLLASGQAGDSVSGRLLGTRPFRFVGLISYSLYLWHWPLLVLLQNGVAVFDQPMQATSTKLWLFLTSLAFGTLSWWLVETPFRKGRWRPARRQLFTMAAMSTAVVLAVAVAMSLVKPAASPYDAQIARIDKSLGEKNPSEWRTGSCFLLDTDRDVQTRLKPCLEPAPGRRNYLLWGDSTAAALYPGLSSALPDIHFLQATKAGCPPVEDAAGGTATSVDARGCRPFQRYIGEGFLASYRPEAVLLVAKWTRKDLPALSAEIDRLRERGLKVIVVGPPLAFDAYLPKLLSAEMRRTASAEVHQRNLARHMRADYAESDGEMASLAHDAWHVPYISQRADWCGQAGGAAVQPSWLDVNGCPLVLPTGEPMTFDDDHLTVTASNMMARIMRDKGQLP